MKNLRQLMVLIALVTLFSASALSQTSTEAATTPTTGARTSTSDFAFGVRAGYTGWNGINQAHLGAHLKFGEVLPNVQFTPNIEAGFGDDITIITVNGDVAYNFTEFVAAPWNVYGGGALSFNYLNSEFSESETDIGLSALIGLEHTFANNHEGLVEIRVGLMDSPDFKLTFGYTLF